MKIKTHFWQPYWNLTNVPENYKYSSAGFYESGIKIQNWNRERRAVGGTPTAASTNRKKSGVKRYRLY